MKDTKDSIRSYGAGKFSTILDSYVYDVSLNGGCDEEIGSVDENGAWYGLMRHGRTIFKDHDPMLESLNEAEQEQLTRSAGVILTEDSSGFVYVEYYDTDKELDTAWSLIEQEIETAESDEEDEDSEPEPDEDSITTEDNLKFYQYGKLVFELTEDEDRNAGIKRELDRMQYWPNVFVISDHGNSCLIEYWKA